MFKWLSNDYSDFVSNFKDQYCKTVEQGCSIPKKVWICWWDGIDNMPVVVKTCYNSVKMNAKDFEITVVTKDNYTNYISLPQYIIDKLASGIISITHFSDILRMSLLAKNGGLWIDATVLVTNTINLDLYKHFFTVSREGGGGNISNRRWTCNCIGGTPNYLLFLFVVNFYYDYWAKYNVIIDYHLFDYIIDFAYNSVPEIKNNIDKINKNNPNYMTLQDNLGITFKDNLFNEITKDTFFHKLSWKKNHPIMNTDNELTFYVYILQKYK